MCNYFAKCLYNHPKWMSHTQDNQLIDSIYLINKLRA